ncbi:MAG: hypothetical protein L0Z73_10905 [Gammaproteobacteria bacterium]|nr:hypothetical protein [Gammaproteobacteria bacterium]
MCLFVIAHAGIANEATDRRVQISLPLFPRIVAVDNRFREKLTADNKARLVFVYDRDKSRANDLAKTVGTANKNIVDVRVDTVPVPLIEQLKENSQTPTAIFVAEPLGEADFKQLVLYSINRGIIVFSPYSGDVERGATVGLAITSRVFPYFNNNTLEASGVEINPILLDISKRYE